MATNLLRDAVALEDIRRILDAHPRRALLPPLDSAEWQVATRHPKLQELAKSIRARAETEAEESMPPLTDELYAIYHQTGSRWEFETVYFERRRRLARAAISLLLSEAGDPARPRLIASLLSKWRAIFEEPAWAFPAHVNMKWFFPDQEETLTGKNPLQIDLFGAESANLMTELLDLFGVLVPDDFRAAIQARLREQFWLNYLGRTKYPAFVWQTITNNWNAVCHQGVLGSALSGLEDNGILAEMLFKARTSLPLFLSGFGPDGGSSEGPGYWDYGFGWFIVLNEQLEARTGDELSLIAGDGHIAEIARFGPRTSLSGGQLLCFSDSPSTGILRPSTLFYMGERLDDSLCREQGRVNYGLKLRQGVDLDFQRSDLFYLARFFLRCPAELSEESATLADREVYLKDLAVVLARATDPAGHLWEFAAKAGHNEEHHNHNDCGNYILNIDGQRLVTEIGQPLYDADFFGPKRYQNLAARTLGHSLPIVNGCEQAAGKEYAAKVLEYESTADGVRFRVELTECYPKEAACLRLVRSIYFEKAGRLTVRDEFELSELRNAETAVATVHPVELGKDFAVIAAGGLRLELRLEPGTILSGVEEHFYHHHDPMVKEPVSIRRVVLRPEGPGTSFTLGFVAELR